MIAKPYNLLMILLLLAYTETFIKLLIVFNRDLIRSMSAQGLELSLVKTQFMVFQRSNIKTTLVNLRVNVGTTQVQFHWLIVLST